jgi:hypothetical protein
MAEKIVLETEIKTGNSATSVKSVKQELRSLQQEMANLEIGSEAFTRAAQKAAGLKDRIDDAAAGVKAFNPEAKFAAFAGVLGGVANGFAAAQGAMALFGSENKDIEQAILKTQGAMALATGISGLGGMADAVGLLASKIRVQLVAAFSSMKAAMISTGIGALVVALGIAISEIMDYNQAIEDAAGSQKKLNEENEKFISDLEKVASASEKARNAKKGGLDDLKRELELLEAKGATEKEIYEKKQEIAEKEFRNARIRMYSGLDTEKEMADKQNEIKANQLAYEKKIEDDKLKARKEAAEKKKIKDEKEFTEQMYQEIDSMKMMNQMIEEMESADWKKALEELENQSNIKTSLSEEEANKLLAIRKLTNEEIAKMAFMSYSEQLEYLKKLAEADKKLDEEKAQAKIDSLKMTSAALNQFAQLAGEQTAEGKALGVAAATIDTYVSAGSAYAAAAKIDPIVLAPLAAAGAIAAGLARVKAILSVKVPGGGGGGSAPSAPSVPQFNPAVAQQVQGGGDVQLGMKPQKVYVVESDIRGTMNKVDVIQSNATIG